jgi:hypothetical protein
VGFVKHIKEEREGGREVDVSKFEITKKGFLG